MRLRDVISILEELYPLEDKLFDSDNIGLQVGDMNKDTKKVLLTLDMTPEVANEAVNEGVDLVIAHHPFIFHPITSVRTDDYFGSAITKIIKNDIALYVMHTNYDNNVLGMGFHLLNHLGVKNITHVDASAMVYGDLDKETTHEEFIKLLKDKYQLIALGFSGNQNDKIQKVGLIGGSGFDQTSIIEASKLNLDAYISGDITYKDALFAKTQELNVYDVGHYVENIGFMGLMDILNKRIDGVHFTFSKLNNPHIIKK